jgi:hypothetical protein
MPSIEASPRPILPASKSWILRHDVRNSWGIKLIYDHLDGTRLITAVERIKDSGLEYHVSISQNGRRVSSQHARQVLLGLDTTIRVEEWLEDNHQPGIARNFWCHTDPAKRAPCPCEATEKPIAEGDFVWRQV